MHYSFLLTQLINELDQIDGRKKFQKIVHILQSAGAPFTERFEYAHFGPYSANLRAKIGTLCEHGYLSEEPAGAAFHFTRGKRFSEIKGEDFLRHSPEWADFARALNGKAPRELEALSTIIFLRKFEFDHNQVQERFAELKPHLLDHFPWADELAGQVLDSPGAWESLTEGVRAAA